MLTAVMVFDAFVRLCVARAAMKVRQPVEAFFDAFACMECAALELHFLLHAGLHAPRAAR